jgi:hypothetical protein
MNARTLSVRLSTEELMLVLWLLNTPTLPGMGPNPFGDWSAEQIGAALASAERSLRARRLVSKAEDGTIQMDQVVMALVGTCAVPEFSLVLTSEAPDTGRIVHYFHATHLLAVEHSNPEPGVHLFEALSGAEAIVERIGELMQLADQPAPNAKPAQVPFATLEQVTQLVLEDPQKAMTTLLNAGMDERTASELINTLGCVRRRSALASVRHLREATPASDGFIVLEGPNGLWAMQMVEDDHPVTKIWAISAADVRIKVKELVSGEVVRFP